MLLLLSLYRSLAHSVCFVCPITHLEMPKAITKNLWHCLSGLKSPSSWSGAPDKTQDPISTQASSSSSSSTIPFKNFNSIHDHTVPASFDSETYAGSAVSSKSATLPTTTTATTGTANSDASTTDTFPYTLPYDRDLSSAIASRRLIPPSSPSLSSAIADPAAVPVGIGVAVPTYSTDPYEDFLRSMKEMARATGLLDRTGAQSCGRRRCERLYELLLCYLVFNRKHAHRYIVGAFAELLLAPPESAAAEALDVGEKEERSGRRHLS